MDHSKQDIFNLESFKDLFDHAHDLIHIVEPDGSILYINNAWHNLFGYSEQEVQGRSLYSFVDPSDRERFKAYRKRVLLNIATDKQVTVSMITKDGRKVFVEGFVSAKIINDRPVYTKGIFRDITTRVQNEAKLKERETNLRQLLHYAPDAIIVIDTESVISYWNPKAQAIFGWSAEEVIGQSLTEIIIPVQYREAHKRGMKRYLATGVANVLNRTIEITALDKNGREFYVSLTISTTYRNGEVSFIAFLRDIDDQKRNALELEQKKIELEESNKQLEQFAHVASHDLKEPIRKIRVFFGLLQNQIHHKLSPEDISLLGKIDSAASRLNDMVEGVLAYSTVKAEIPVVETIDLNEVMKAVETDLELMIQQTEAIINYDALPVIEGSRFLLCQLFYNLVNNSLKFIRPEGTPVIEIKSRILMGDATNHFQADALVSYAEIIVSDNGIGFAQEQARNVFTTFTRLHAKDKYEGTGLGLSLCKNIVEKHKGFITAFGKEGQGASFVIYLPEKQ